MEEWAGISCIGGIHARTETAKGKTDERHCFISSRKLTPGDLLMRARMEWPVETMHWLPDAHFGEDFCRVEDMDVQQNPNMARKIALNSVRCHKAANSIKLPMPKIMLGCLLDPSDLLAILESVEN